MTVTVNPQGIVAYKSFGHISPDAINAVILQLAEEHPDATYKRAGVGGCSYVDGSAYDRYTGWEETGCIFGQALREIGVPEEVLYNYAILTIQNLCTVLGIEFQESWASVQSLQDRQVQWDLAVQPLRLELKNKETWKEEQDKVFVQVARMKAMAREGKELVHA